MITPLVAVIALAVTLAGAHQASAHRLFPAAADGWAGVLTGRSGGSESGPPGDAVRPPGGPSLPPSPSCRAGRGAGRGKAGAAGAPRAPGDLGETEEKADAREPGRADKPGEPGVGGPGEKALAAWTSTVGTATLARMVNAAGGAPGGAGGPGGRGGAPGGDTAWPEGAVRRVTAPARRSRALSGRVAAAAALRQVGRPYVWGGGSSAGPTGGGFDCSGLALYAWSRAGVRLPHHTGGQFRQGRRVPFPRLRAGDLVFFGGGAKDPAHVGVYVKDGVMVHAPKSGATVTTARFAASAYYRARYRGAVRPAP
ncbi:hypothetical protein GCM10017673_18190 [Streptosporangium violaceochromogenes]|nr:hypothetical protein GCM10017673_18190 [Streptosporangium violaceochromogenes]